MTRGKFIVFEGGEGSGKSSHIALTQQYLQQRSLPVLATHEPGGTVLGQQLRQALLQTTDQPTPWAELFIFLADRTQHVSTVLQPKLEEGVNILCDRFYGSTLAYQLGGRGLQPSDYIIQLEQFARQQLEPDIVFYLDIDPTIGLKRKQQQTADQMTRFEHEVIDFHTNVRSYFQALAQQHANWHVIDANRSLNIVQQDIITTLTSLWP